MSHWQLNSIFLTSVVKDPKIMKPSKEQLYDAMGELIYALAMADGIIQSEELSELEKLLLSHPWSASIKWSFDYEQQKNNPLDFAYNKALQTCKDYGPSEEYAFLMEVLKNIAEASNGVVKEEAQLINRFKEELTNYFRENL